VLFEYGSVYGGNAQQSSENNARLNDSKGETNATSVQGLECITPSVFDIPCHASDRPEGGRAENLHQQIIQLHGNDTNKVDIAK
jgi:hypothetical protein